MNLSELQTFINNREIDKLKSTLEISKYAYFISDAFNVSLGATGASGLGNTQNTAMHIRDFKQYNPKQHMVCDPVERRDKSIYDVDDKGNQVFKERIPVARIPIPEQKKIVLFAKSFLGVPELSSTPKPGIETDMHTVVQAIHDDNKMEYKFMDIMGYTMSERECAELWYVQDAEPDYWDGTPLEGNKRKVRVKILAPSLGDTLFPVWDAFGDMVAFIRYYETVETDINLVNTTNRTAHMDIYTQDRFYFATKVEGDWAFNLEADPLGNPTSVIGVPNIIGKIPLIYYCQPLTEWHDVEEMIERLEFKISNHADTNDYFDSPVVFAEGNVKGFATKGEAGKLIEGDQGAKVSYLTWDNAPNSMKMEIDHLVKFIHTHTHTPDISFDNIKGLGTFTGIALKMFFMDAHLKAKDKEALFGSGVQRRINFLKDLLVKLDKKFAPAKRLSIKPYFDYFLPKNDTEELDNIIKSVNAGILSIESAVKMNPLVEDAISELALIQKEKLAAVKAAQDAMAAAAKANPAPPTNGKPAASNGFPAVK